MMSPQTEAPRRAARLNAPAESEVVMRTALRPMIIAKVAKMMSRTRVIWYVRIPLTVSGFTITAGMYGIGTGPPYG